MALLLLLSMPISFVVALNYVAAPMPVLSQSDLQLGVVIHQDVHRPERARGHDEQTAGKSWTWRCHDQSRAPRVNLSPGVADLWVCRPPQAD